ncbi:MAG: phage tail assembly chaperone G [Sarcina sp.]
MNIVLNINGENKSFSARKITGMKYRRFLEIQSILSEVEEKQLPFKLEHYDMLVTFLVEVFDNKFTEEELLEGVGADEIQIKWIEVAKEVDSRTKAGMQKLTKN